MQSYVRFILFAAVGLGVAGCDPFNADFEDVEPAVMYTASGATPAAAPSGPLTVMNWNVKFGGGRIDFFFDCHGDRSLMSKAEVIANMEGVASKIAQVDPDILILQEVDVESKRSAYVDQAAWLVANTDLKYAAYASQWRADFIPSDGVGRVNSGNLVMSKWPIVEGTRFALAEITEFWFAKNYFWLHRNVLQTRIEVPGLGDLYVIGTHLAAFSQDGTKRTQLEQLKERMDALDEAGELVIAAGDLNSIPAGSTERKGYPDLVCVDEEFPSGDYTGEDDWLDELYEDYHPAIPLADYQADNQPYLTHTTDKDGFWTQKLDYLFTNGTWTAGSGLVHQDEASGGMNTMELSDHAPVTVSLELVR